MDCGRHAAENCEKTVWAMHKAKQQQQQHFFWPAAIFFSTVLCCCCRSTRVPKGRFAKRDSAAKKTPPPNASVQTVLLGPLANTLGRSWPQPTALGPWKPSKQPRPRSGGRTNPLGAAPPVRAHAVNGPQKTAQGPPLRVARPCGAAAHPPARLRAPRRCMLWVHAEYVVLCVVFSVGQPEGPVEPQQVRYGKPDAL